jgi:hypothetical protein
VTSDEFLSAVQFVINDRPLPKPLSLVEGVRRIRAGAVPAEVAKNIKTTPRRLQGLLGAPDLVEAVLGVAPSSISQKHLDKARRILGQLLVGRAAEIVFEDLYREEMSTHEFELRDHRSSHSGTDYRVHNGQDRPLYRLNIKFHGSQFRRAPELVGLAPEDCFALATYKIKSALEKQDSEHLPYIFAVVGLRHLSAEAVGGQIPDRLVEAVAVATAAPHFQGKRQFEDAVIEQVVRSETPVFRTTYDALKGAPWYVLSARRAVNLMKDKLFERVFALRIRGFAQQFRAAELDMHFSLSSDLTSLSGFFETLKKEGQTKIASLLERGSV